MKTKSFICPYCNNEIKLYNSFIQDIYECWNHFNTENILIYLYVYKNKLFQVNMLNDNYKIIIDYNSVKTELYEKVQEIGKTNELIKTMSISEILNITPNNFNNKVENLKKLEVFL